MTEKIEKKPEEWKEQLTPDQYEICINHGTEPPFSGKYNDTKLEGSFKCTCCGEELFSSDAKFIKTIARIITTGIIIIFLFNKICIKLHYKSKFYQYY